MKRIIGILCGLFFFLSSFAQETFQKETYISSRGDTLLYRLLRPEVMKPDEKYPLVLFLHGAGECGNDNEKQLVHGGQMWLNPVNREKYPAFILAPQCPETGYWAYAERPSSFVPEDMPLEVPVSPVFRTLKELLDTYLAMPQIDKDRIYVMGLSMGGMGTFDMAVRYPEIFAAAIPICGTVNPARLKAGKSVKFRIFHGDADNVVTPEGSGNVVKGKVARMTDFGAFVELAPGVDALLHVSQIAKEHIEKPSDVLKVGQEIEAKIVDFNEDEKKISLSIKALLAPETNESEDADVADVDIDAVAAEEN